MKILTLDIETAPAIVYAWGIHEQRLGAHLIIEDTRMICWAAKWYDKPGVMFASERGIKTHAAINGEYEMLPALWSLLDEADAVVHYNGTSFDVKHINREFLLAGMGPPSPYAQIDLWRTVRGQFKFLSTKLDEVAKRLDLGSKDSTDFALWPACMAGDEKAWRKMERYNKQDVKLTERLYDELRPWIKAHPSRNLIDGTEHTCPVCGSGDLQKRGLAHTKTSSFQRFQCNDCGSYSRAGKRVAGVDLRAV